MGCCPTGLVSLAAARHIGPNVWLCPPSLDCLLVLQTLEQWRRIWTTEMFVVTPAVVAFHRAGAELDWKDPTKNSPITWADPIVLLSTSGE